MTMHRLQASHGPQRVRQLWPTLAVAAVSALLASPVAAQDTRIDPRFQPWVGCWKTVGTTESVIDGGQASVPNRACVLPSASVAGSVDVVMLSGAREISRSALPLPGRTVDKRVDECTGTERAEWVADDTRLILRAELMCDRGIRRVETALMSIAPTGEWLQLQTLEVGKNVATTVARLRYVGDSGAPGDLGTQRSNPSQRLAVGGSVTLSQVVDVSKRVPTGLAEAWLAETGVRFDLNGERLVALADAGTPPGVIDMLVAMANPKAFSLRPSDALGAQVGQSGALIDATQTAVMNRNRSRCGDFDDFCYGPGGMGAWGFGWQFGMNPWGGFDPWGMRYGFSPFGPLGFNNGFNNGFGWGPGVFWGNRPIVIVNRPPNDGSIGGGGVAMPRGRAVNGGGYTRTPDSGPRGSMSPAGASGGSMGGGATGGSSGGSSSGSTGRTAKPRGGG